MHPVTTLCRHTFAREVKRRDPRPARVDVIAERFPVGVSPRYRVRTLITTADMVVHEREARSTDDPARVISAIDAADFEFGDMPLIMDSVIGGSDPDASMFG